MNRPCDFTPPEVAVAGQGAAASAGLSTDPETASRIHIPAAPCPGTAQKIWNAPLFAATNRTSAPCPDVKPCSSRPVVACSNAGGTGPLGTTGPSAMISTECGRFGSSFLKCSTTFHPCGTVRTRPPWLKPLKFIPPFASVRPATSLKSAALLAASALSHAGSTLPPFPVWARAPTAPRRSAPIIKLVGSRMWTLSFSDNDNAPLVQQPRQDVQRVVIARPASEPVVVARAAVELVVCHVLELQPQVLPRHDVDLGNQAVVVGTTGTTPRHGRRSVEQSVARAPRDERREGERVPRADVVHGVHPEGAKCVRGVRRAAGGPGLLLVDPRTVERETVRPERVHVREVHGNIGESIGRPSDAGREDARRDTVGSDRQVVLAPHVRERDSPVRRRAFDHTRSRRIERALDPEGRRAVGP